jgi:hypothetical protein
LGVVARYLLSAIVIGQTPIFVFIEDEPMKRPIIVGAVVGVASIVSIVLITLVDPAIRSQLGVELIKTLLQVVVIVIFGGTVSLLMEDFNRQRARADAHNDLRKSLLNRLIRAHKDTKRARRLLRAKQTLSNYDEQIEVISDLELDVESVAEEIQTSRPIFAHPDELAASLRSMTDYLRLLINEYENLRPKLREEALSNRFTLARLHDLVGPYKESGFSTEFTKSYRKAIDVIQRDILKAG